MGVNRKSRLRTAAPGFISLVFLCLAILPAFTEDFQVEYEIANNPVGVKDNIYVNIYISHPRPDEVSVTAPPLPKSLQITRGPKISPVADKGIFRTWISYRLRGDASGRYIIKPFIIEINGDTLETEPRILEVGVYRNRQLYIPLDVEWLVPEGKIYAGQSVLISLRLLNQLKIPLVDTFDITYPKGAFFEDAVTVGEIEDIPVGSHHLYNIPISSFIFTPSQSGRLFLPSAEIEALGQAAESGTVRIDVLPLPRDVRESGAVGSFSYQASLEKSKHEFGAVGKLFMRIEGTGNLVLFEFPEPDF
ncbi:MAG: hypothetical protein HN368_23310, partial [Spirochaetales bacterium]|nr:hypothetical protein [Spirochaetales bacterium]